MPKVDLKSVVYSSTNLKKLRQERNLSRKELAERSGVSLAAIGYYEADERDPSTKALKKLAKVLEVRFIIEY